MWGTRVEGVLQSFKFYMCNLLKLLDMHVIFGGVESHQSGKSLKR